MQIYIGFLVILLIVGLVLYKYNRIDSKGKIIVILLGFAGLYTISALRREDIGKDLWNYLSIFYRHSDLTFVQLLAKTDDPGFRVLNKLISMLTEDKQHYIAIISFLTLIGPFRLIFKYSKNPVMSIYLYVTLTFFAFSLSGIRFAIGASLLYFTYDYIVQKKLFKFIAIVLIASLFHSALILYLVAYPISRIRLTPKNMILFLSGLLLTLAIKEPLLRYLVTNYFNEYEYSLIKSLSVNYLLSMILVFSLGYIMYSQVINNNQDAVVQFNMMLCAILIQLFAMESSNIVRLAQLFYFYVIIFVPEVISSMKYVNNRLIANISVYVMSMGIYILIFNYGGYGTVPYVFFWH